MSEPRLDAYDVPVRSGYEPLPRNVPWYGMNLAKTLSKCKEQSYEGGEVDSNDSEFGGTLTYECHLNITDGKLEMLESSLHGMYHSSLSGP